MVEYKLFNKKEINGKKRNIYKKKGSNKQYIKSKGKMMNLAKYKKLIKNKKLKKGGVYDTSKTVSSSDKQRFYDASSDNIKPKTDLSKILKNPPTSSLNQSSQKPLDIIPPPRKNAPLKSINIQDDNMWKATYI
jgi:hypothetical protein